MEPRPDLERGHDVEDTCSRPGCVVAIDHGSDFLCGTRSITPEIMAGCGKYFCYRHVTSHDCPRPECGALPHNDECTREACCLVEFHRGDHSDAEGVRFELMLEDNARAHYPL